MHPVSVFGSEASALLDRLRDASPAQAAQLEREIQLEWDRSGSATADLLRKRGADALERGEYDIAVEHFTALVDHAPDFAEGWVERARAFAALGMFGPAVGDLEHALALEPRHYQAIAGLAELLEAMNMPDDAYTAWEQVKVLHPHHEAATEALARLAPQVKGQEL
ncbi:hypothetical protein [Shimia biformata]|uniref:hypothetical protein n=1 Tax=Shimia biformata TaxID=1294299 RepID=UPI001EF1D42D|nr:hypothetical protein [Shimia biformata]